MKTSPSSPYGKFAEKGYQFEASLPASPAETCAFLVKASNAATGQALFSYLVPMLHPPIFGVDVGDSASLEAATDLVIAQLPATDEYSTGTFEQLQGDAGLKAQCVTLTDLTQQ